MLPRLGLLAGVLALVTILWFLLQRPAARGGEPWPAAGPAPAEARREDPLAEPLAPVPGASGSARIARDGPETVVAATGNPPPIPLLRVRVHDELGALIAGVGVLAELQSEALGRRSYFAVSAAGGLATFATLAPGAAATGDVQVRVALDGLFEPPVELRFPAEPWPAEPVELVMPATGSVIVAVFDEQGEPLVVHERDVELRLERELLPGAQIWRERALARAPLEDGVARFPAVGLGLRCSASYDDRPDHPRAELALEGPERPGEEVRVELRLPAPEGVVTLRLFAPDGRALVATEVEANLTRVIGGGSFSSGDTRTTDAEARLVVPLREGWQEGQERRLTILHRPADGPECKAEVDLSRELAGGSEDLGDIVLRARPVLVSGRVVDVEGNGITDVTITIEHRFGEEDWGHVTWGEVGADGRFAFYDNPPDSPLRLSADSDEHQPLDPLPFAPGTTGLELVLRRGVRLHGSVLAPEGMNPLGLEVTAAGANERDRRGTAADTSGVFELTGLAPGPYDVEFRLRPTNERLLVVPGVLARESDEPDPRLVDVDLRALARRVRLGVHSADGAPAPGGWVHVLANADAQQIAFVIEAGEAELLVPAAGSDVEVSVPGHRLLRIEDLAADREVRLEAAFRVRCELAPDVPLPPGGSLQLRLVPVAGGEPSSSHYTLYRAHEQVGWFSTAFGDDQNTFDERRELMVSVQEPGTYDVFFHLVQGSASGGRISYALQAGGANAKITLDEGSAGQTFVLAPEREAYAARLAGK